MDIENKLDEDFVFYLGFVNTFFKHIREKEIRHKCEQWLQKLCGEVCRGVELKRCRNIYLSQLLLCMQTGILSKEFLQPVNEVDISNAEEVFQLQSKNIEKPEWLQDNDAQVKQPEVELKKGRTYVATRALPDGQGAFAYVAVSLEDDEQKWLGGGEGICDTRMEQKYKDDISDIEMEKILARRKDPKEREKVVTFYSVLLQNIEDELEERVEPCQNEPINGLVEQMEKDLKAKNEWCKYECMSEKDRRNEFLLILHGKIKLRINKVMKREELLNEIETQIQNKSFLAPSAPQVDQFQLPAAMWEQAINKAPTKKNVDKLRDNYPIEVIEKFLELLSNHKEEIANMMQKRHENIAAQMKKELQREDEKGKKLVDDAQIAYEHTVEVMKVIKERYDKVVEIENKNATRKDLPQSEQSKLYEEMKAALYDTQKSVEEEAARGRALAAEISIASEQKQLSLKEYQDNIRKVEEANVAIMRNIKRLNTAIKIQKERMNKIKTTVGKLGSDEFDESA